VIDGARLVEYLSAALDGARVGLAEPPAPISGGFDTQIYSLRLVGVPPHMSGPLILRVLSPQYDPRRALREQAIQNAVAEQGYPAPRVPIASADPSVLGAGFLIMERLPGRTLLAMRRPGMADVLVRAQRQLHALDPAPVVKAIEAAVPGGSAEHTVAGQLAQYERRVARGALLGLAPALGWLRANRPTVEGPAVICHGDFHPQNVLVDERRHVTGVIDWPNMLVAERACDVADSRVILRYAPVEVSEVPRSLKWLVRAARLALVSRYMRGQRQAAPLDPVAFRYYEALGCMRGFLRVAEQRTLAARGGAALSRLDASNFAERLAQRFAQLTGVRPSLPPIKGSSR
jgi:aminoglycoside phosphotransferase (APT) family kinase protein